MELAILLAAFASNVVCFWIGAKVSQKVQRGEVLEAPNPMKAIRENRSRKEAEFEANRESTILENIENYDGTGRGQKDIPRR